MHNLTGFFLAANTAQGFYSLFDELYIPDEGWKAFIIKGGPGTGKSSFMKRIAEKAESKKYNPEYIYCSSDPESLDAIIIPELKLCYADGTAPHIIEPKYPGCVEEIINLGQFWNSKMLENNTERIMTLTNCNKALHSNSAEYVSACYIAMNDTQRIIATAYNNEKGMNYATRMLTRLCNFSNGHGVEKKRFINGITPDGYVTLYSTANALCDKIYSVSDDFSFASASLMNSIRLSAIENGINIITCLNPFNPDGFPLHIILPDYRTGFFTSDYLQDFRSLAEKNIYAKRFLDEDIIKIHKQRLAFNKRTSKELLSEAVKLLSKAKRVHDDLEKCYIDAMDFERLNRYTDEIISSVI